MSTTCTMSPHSNARRACVRPLLRARFVIAFALAIWCGARANASITGVVDGVGYENGLTVVSGWACDVGRSEAIAVHLYASDPDTGTYTFVAQAWADVASGDPLIAQNCASNNSNHRFKISIGDYGADNAGRRIYVHGISITGGGNDALTGSGSSIFPDTIYADINGSPIQIRAARRYGGAITSMQFRGHEFVNNFDHGRQFQIAGQFHGFGECYNPTEAGAINDGQGLTSRSRLLQFSTYDNVLYTRNNPAFWAPPGNTVAYCTDTIHDQQAHRDYAKDTQPVSNYEFRKSIQFGYAGIPNVIHMYSQVNVPWAQDEPSSVVNGNGVQLEAFSNNMPASFSRFWEYDVCDTSGQPWHELDASNPNEQRWRYRPTVVEKPDPSCAPGDSACLNDPTRGIALASYAPEVVSQVPGYGTTFLTWSKVLPDPAYPSPEYPMSGLGVIHWSDAPVPQGGMIQNHSYLVVGTRSEVAAGLTSLHAHFGGACGPTP